MSQYCVQLQLKSILIEERLSYDLIIAGLLQWLFVTETPVAIYRATAHVMKQKQID